MAEEIVRALKAKRAVLRTAVTKYCSKIETDLQNSDTNVNDLEELVELLFDKTESLKHVDTELEKHIKPDESQKEFETIADIVLD